MTQSPHGDENTAGRNRTLAKPAQTPQRRRVQQLLKEYRKTRDPKIRDELVQLNTNLVHYIAQRFANRGEPIEDIEQVGFLGLIQAIERFDPSLENEFSTFATPTIMGEIRRYFRDRSWALRVPRRLQEDLARVRRAEQELQTTLGRPPSIDEIATHLELEPEDVLAALEVSPAQHAVSLQSGTTANDHEDQVALADRLGGEDENLERVEMQEVLERAMAHLTPRERQIMVMRFIDELPQTEVAERLGISQMHVSRLQRAAVDRLKSEFGGKVPV